MINNFGALGVGPNQNNRGSRFDIGGIVSGIGGLIGASASNDAAEAAAEAAQFNPYNVSGAFGGSTFGPGNTASASLGQPFAGLQNYYLSQTGAFNNQLSPFFAPHPAQFVIPGAPGGVQSSTTNPTSTPNPTPATNPNPAPTGTTGNPNFQFGLTSDFFLGQNNGLITGGNSNFGPVVQSTIDNFDPNNLASGFQDLGNGLFSSGSPTDNSVFFVPEGTNYYTLPAAVLNNLNSEDGLSYVVTYNPDAFPSQDAGGNPNQGVPPVQIPSVINFDPFSGLPIFNIAPNANGTPGQALPPGFQNGPITPVLGSPNTPLPPGQSQQTTRGTGAFTRTPTAIDPNTETSGSVPTTTKPEVQGIPGQQFGQGGYPGNLVTAGQVDWQAYNQALANWRSPEQVIFDRLQTLSAPDEALERSTLENRLFAQGMLGSTGGRERQNALLDAQQTNRLQREHTAVGLAETIQNMIQQRGLAGLQAAISLGLLPNDYLALGGNFGAQQASAGANVGQILANNGGQQANNISAFFSSLGNNLNPGVFSSPTTPGFVPSSPVFGGGNPYTFSTGNSGFGIQ